MKKAAAFLGLGTESIFMIKTDDKGRMIPEDLEKQINETISKVNIRMILCDFTTVSQENISHSN